MDDACVSRRFQEHDTSVTTVMGDKVVQLSHFNPSKAAQVPVFRLVSIIKVLNRDIIDDRLYLVG